MDKHALDPACLLGDRLQTLSRAELTALAEALCRILAERGTYHGGIRPDNISRAADGTVGLGAPARTDTKDWTTEELEFMAPEVFWSGTLDASADVYSLGLLLYAGVSGGRLPFYPDDRAPLPEDQTDALRRRMNGEALPPARKAGRGLQEIIARATQCKPDDRYATPAELCAALEQYDAEQRRSVPTAQEMFNKPEQELSEVERMMLDILAEEAAAPVPEAEPEIAAEPEAEAESELKFELKTEAEEAPVIEPEAELESEAKPEETPAAEPEAKPEETPAAEPEAKPEETPVTEPKPQPEHKPEPQPLPNKFRPEKRPVQPETPAKPKSEKKPEKPPVKKPEAYRPVQAEKAAVGRAAPVAQGGHPADRAHHLRGRAGRAAAALARRVRHARHGGDHPDADRPRRDRRPDRDAHAHPDAEAGGPGQGRPPRRDRQRREVDARRPAGRRVRPDLCLDRPAPYRQRRARLGQGQR